MPGPGWTEESYLAHRERVAPVWDKRLRAHKAETDAKWGGRGESLAALLANFRSMMAPDLGPQMPAAVAAPPGSLEAILNALRVANPRPSLTPPPIIGVRG